MYSDSVSNRLTMPGLTGKLLYSFFLVLTRNCVICVPSTRNKGRPKIHLREMYACLRKSLGSRSTQNQAPSHNSPKKVQVGEDVARRFCT